MQKNKYWYIFLLLFGVFAIAINAYNLNNEINSKDNFRIFLRGIMVFVFLIWTLSIAQKLKKILRGGNNN